MWATAIIAGLSLGAVSSLHCVGMCGPLALALPVHHLSRVAQMYSLLLYQFGRVLSYAGFGLVFGLAGRRIYLAGFQQGFSIVMGVVVLLLVVLYWIYKNPLQPSVLKKFYTAVQNYMFRAFRSRRGPLGFVLLGMANGLLPCAMVYLAIAGALTAASVGYSILFMSGFGFGTMPAMLLVGVFGRMASLPVRNMFRQSIPVFMTVVGLVLILRGLNLGIPFLSPVMESHSAVPVNCHN